jgi:hypothetical protein
MTALESEIDRLYQLPLGEFTAARNSLAVNAGARKAEVKALVKPTAAAWAVNQLFWHKRAVLNKLIAAAERVRAAQVQAIGGDRRDVAESERAHDQALAAAVAEARGLLEAAGENPSAQVLIDIRETLQTLPSEAPVGRLTRPLQPLGFDALLKMMPALPHGKVTPTKPTVASPAAAPAPPARETRSPRVAPPEPPVAARHARVDEVAERRRQREAEARAAREAAEHAEAERRRERASVEAKLRDARSIERVRGNAVTRLRDELQRATREQQRRQAALDEQRAIVERLTEDIATAEGDARSAVEARAALEAALAKLT